MNRRDLFRGALGALCAAISAPLARWLPDRLLFDDVVDVWPRGHWSSHYKPLVDFASPEESQCTAPVNPFFGDQSGEYGAVKWITEEDETEADE